jgi:hypothetical protein
MHRHEHPFGSQRIERAIHRSLESRLQRFDDEFNRFDARAERNRAMRADDDSKEFLRIL